MEATFSTKKIDGLGLLACFVPIFGILIIYFAFSPVFAYSLTIVFGVWLLDVVLKRTHKYKNETIFADLSFTSLIYFCGQKIIFSSLPINTFNDITIEPVIFYFPIIIILSVTWIINLYLCKNIELNDNLEILVKENRTILIITGLIGLFSSILALIPDYLLASIHG